MSLTALVKREQREVNNKDIAKLVLVPGSLAYLYAGTGALRKSYGGRSLDYGYISKVVIIESIKLVAWYYTISTISDLLF